MKYGEQIYRVTQYDRNIFGRARKIVNNFDKTASQFFHAFGRLSA